jgi:hypothetical protein
MEVEINEKSQKQKSISSMNILIESDKNQIHKLEEIIGRMSDSIKSLEDRIKIRKDVLDIVSNIPDDDNYEDNYWSNVEIEKLRKILLN